MPPSLPQPPPLPPEDINPYQPPASNVLPEVPVIDPRLYPGIKRLAFLASVFLISLTSQICASYTTQPWATSLMYLSIVPVCSRLRNIGWHPAWCLLSFVPLLSLIVTIPCFVLPTGYRHHRRLDTAAKVGFAICLLFVLFLITLLVTTFT
ncbi:hypothetical protein [Prosthecobacter sp.]|uniref:hypothetical protein n=1 Tax=Prosthecobacter sp. TaxID=1965333 RepID=UPI003784C34D